MAERINGLYDEIRPGRPRSQSDEEVAEMLTKALEKPGMQPIGVAADLPQRLVFRNPPLSVFGALQALNRTVLKDLSCLLIPFLLTRSGTLSACI